MTVRTELELLAERYAQAWNARDLSALCADFAPDADWVDAHAGLWHGRAAIAGGHERLFHAMAREATLRFQIAKTRLLSGKTALVHVIWSIAGYGGNAADGLPVRTGLSLFVASRQSGVWQVVCCQITDVPIGSDGQIPGRQRL